MMRRTAENRLTHGLVRDKAATQVRVVANNRNRMPVIVEDTCWLGSSGIAARPDHVHPTLLAAHPKASRAIGVNEPFEVATQRSLKAESTRRRSEGGHAVCRIATQK